jgi:predicted ATPase
MTRCGDGVNGEPFSQYAANPVAYFDRGPLTDEQLVTGGFWSAYWYNGHIYGSEITRVWTCCA